MRKTLTVIVLTVSACGDSAGPNGGANLTGTWQWSESFSNQQLAVSCNASGTANLTHTGNGLSGTAQAQGTCNGPGGVVDNSGTSTISGGQVNGTSVVFTAGGCNYTGSMSGSPPNRISGTQSCVEAILGQNFTFTGTWQASR